MADLKTNLLGFVMNSPVIGASGTVGYGVEYEELADFAKIGGISGKGLTLHGQYGNKGERLWETPSGLINSIGLQNPGVQHFIDVELPEMLELKQKYGTVAIANLGGHSEEEYVEGAAMLSESGVDIVELNISCPNVKVGGMAYGGVTPANAAFVSSYYGMRHYAVNLSVVVTNLLFASFGSTIAGALYDATGSYLSTDAMILVLAVLSAAVSFGIDLCDRRMLKRR